MKNLISVILFCLLSSLTIAQQKKYAPKIEACDCRFKMDSDFIKTAPANLQAAFAAPFDKIDSSLKPGADI
jgi:hypothetical protein